MAAKKKPAPAPITEPSTQGQGIAAIQQSPFALTGSQIVNVPGREGGQFYGEYDSAKAELDSITELLARAEAARAEFGAGGLGQAPKTQVIFNEQTYNLDQFEKEVARLRKLQVQAKKRFDAINKIVKPLDAKVEKIKDQINAAGDNLERENKWRAQLPAAEKEAAAAKLLPVGTKATLDTVKKEAAKPNAPRQVTSAAQFRMAEERLGAPTKPVTSTTETVAGTTKTGGKTKVTGGTSGTVKEETPTETGLPDWAEIVKEEFGPLWDVYNSNADVKEVLDRSVKEGWFNDDVKLTESLRGTGWYATTEKSARQFAIRQSTDPASLEDEINTSVEDLRQSSLSTGLTLSDQSLRRLATDNIKYGWSAQQMINAIGSEAVASARLGGAQGLKDLRSGAVGQNLRTIASAYAQKIDDVTLDSFIVDIMEGRKTELQFTETMRESAKTQFRSLVPQLDKGQTVDSALYAYKQAAQNTLGDSIDMSQIDWTSDKWNKSLNYRDEKTGEYRQMDLWEWNKYLRTLPEWQNTSEAKQTYSNVAYALAQGFGKIA